MHRAHERRFLVALVAMIFTVLCARATPALAQDGLLGLPDGVSAWDVDLHDLELSLIPLRLDQLEEASGQWLTLLQEEVSRVSRTEIALRRATSPDEAEGLRAQLDRLRQRPIALVPRIEAVLDELEKKGGSTTDARRYLTRVVAGAKLTAAATPDSAKQDAPKPWSLSVAELRNNLMPMRVSQLEREAEAWIVRVEEQARLISQAENRAAASTGAEREAALAEAETLRLQRDAVIERAGIVLDALERKGGDPAAYRKYIEAVTGRAPIELSNVDDVRVRLMTWLKSPDGGLKLAKRIIQVIVILVAFWVLSRLLARAASTTLKRMKNVSGLLRDFIISGIRKLVMLIGIIVAVATLGVNITPLVAALGAAGLVIGLALQGTLSNFASGLLILFYRPFDVGDSIVAGGVSGTVEAMTLVSTVIITGDNQQMIVPNNAIWNGVITNVTGRSTRRVDLTVGVDYRSDLDLVQKILEDIARSHPKVLAEPAPTVRLNEYTDRAINFIVRPWTKTSDYGEVYWDLQRAIKKRFDAEGIAIPFPQHDINFNGPVEIITREA
jgi:small conductance mechanosensitive channel